MRFAACALVLVGCGTQALPLALSPEWPSDPPPLEVATKTWTQTARDLGGLGSKVELIIRVTATYRSPEWRAAYVEHLRVQGNLSAEATAALRAEQEKAASEHSEFVLLVATHDRRTNDLSKGDRSSWRVSLKTAAGEVFATDISKDRRPPAEIGAELPHLESFDEIYIAQFPPELVLVGGGTDKFSLRVFGARGSVELDWVDSRATK